MVTSHIFKARIMLKSILLLVLISIQSCLKDDVLVMKRVDNNTNKIRLKGYYLETKFTHNPYFFYQNGIVFKYSSRELKDSLLIENGMTDINNLNNQKRLKDSWGVYSIQGNSILIERWASSDKPLDAYLMKGTILNDTTFIMTEFSEPDGSKKEVINEVYRFRKFSPKPDSTNMFIK
jgi:hypothetical protein